MAEAEAAVEAVEVEAVGAAVGAEVAEEEEEAAVVVVEAVAAEEAEVGAEAAAVRRRRSSGMTGWIEQWYVNVPSTVKTCR